MASEFVWFLLVGLVAATALVVSLRRPSSLEGEVLALRRENRELRAEVSDLRSSLVTEIIRLRGVEQWLRQQLRENGITIKPLPEDLRPTNDLSNISIHVRAGGVDVTGGTVTNAGDLIGGDKE